MPTGYSEPVLVASTDGVGTKLARGRRGRPPGHDRRRPGRHVRGRPRLPGGRAALLSRLPAVGAPRPRGGGRHHGRYSRWLPPGRVRHPGRRTGRAPRPAGPRARWTWPGSPSGWSNGTACSGPAAPTRAREGDVLVGLHSGGLRSNGYSLVRARAAGPGGAPAGGRGLAGRRLSLADELLRPSLIYTPAVLALFARFDVHAVAHITGGGLPGNVPRALPPDLDAMLDRRDLARAPDLRRGPERRPEWTTPRWPGRSTWDWAWSWRCRRRSLHRGGCRSPPRTWARAPAFAGRLVRGARHASRRRGCRW